MRTSASAAPSNVERSDGKPRLALPSLRLGVGPRADGVTALRGAVVVESMNGARFLHDQLELAGWDVRLADPLRARALAPLACKTDRIDAWVLAELARRDLVPEV